MEAKLPWHSTDKTAVLEHAGSSERGLSEDEARDRLARFGPNVLPTKPPEPWSKIMLRQVTSPIILVLIGSGSLALALGKSIDGAVVLGVVALNAVIGFLQEFRASRAIQSLTSLVPQKAWVTRDGARREVPAEDLTPGDVIELSAGDRLPADVRILRSNGLLTDESPLTGESVPVAKTVDPVAEDAVLGDRTSMAYAGTSVTSGAGAGLVVATAAGTELGRISELLDSAAEMETPLTRNLSQVAKQLTVVIGVVAFAIIGVGMARGYPWMDAILAGITLAVAAIPEGLPAVVTIALAIGVQRMAQRRALIRKLPAVETLGGTQVVCSDKTGTLTKNEMTVEALWTPASTYEVTGLGYDARGELRRGSEVLATPPTDVRALVEAAVLASDAELGPTGPSGDPTEIALVVVAEKLGVSSHDLRERNVRVDLIPFDAAAKTMTVLSTARSREGDAASAKTLIVKGAPEVVLEGIADLRLQGAALAAADAMAAKGLRVLAVARASVAADVTEAKAAEEAAVHELLGLAGMLDPPRPEAIESIAACHSAGIEVKMITGDHPSTAQAIARELNLLRPGQRAISGRELTRLSWDELKRVAVESSVFARVAPEQKLSIVKALQEQGFVVAMTGDGVNDAPALKQADIGVAMGITGTAVSKEAADLVLTDDNFASIRAAIEEGRRVYDNLVKSLAFMLPTNLGEAIIILVAVLAFPIVDGRPLLPVEPVQILWINLVATVALALPLALEAMEPNLMRRAPRRREEPLLGGFVIVRTVLVAVLMAGSSIALFLHEYRSEIALGRAEEVALREAQTMAVLTIVFFQIFYIFNCRSMSDSIFKIGLFTNKWVYVGVATILALQAGFTYLPFMNDIFDSAPLLPIEILKSLIVASVILPAITVEKKIRRWRTTTATTTSRAAATATTAAMGLTEVELGTREPGSRRAGESNALRSRKTAEKSLEAETKG